VIQKAGIIVNAARSAPRLVQGEGLQTRGLAVKSIFLVAKSGVLEELGLKSELSLAKEM
jgi:hypothetical protein